MSGTGELSELTDKFTSRASQLLLNARRESDRLIHPSVGTEHLLLGLVKLGEESTACRVFRELGVSLESIRLYVNKRLTPGTESSSLGGKEYTPRVRKVFRLASKEATSLNHMYIGTEHLVLAMLLEEGGIAFQVFKSLNIDAENFRKKLVEVLDFTKPAQSEVSAITQEPNKVLSIGGFCCVLGFDFTGVIPNYARENENLKLRLLQELLAERVSLVGDESDKRMLFDALVKVLRVARTSNDLITCVGEVVKKWKLTDQLLKEFVAAPHDSPAQRNLGAALQIATGASELTTSVVIQVTRSYVPAIAEDPVSP